ncbi:MAG: 4Fe-4S ferredoxin [Deltaproteobacteria bacterium]|nr:4Fe-4S ferredoxin [Deltaproteobacteria bacterium]
MLSTIILIIIAVVFVGGMVLWLYGERWRFLRPSTWRFMKVAGIWRQLNLSGLHGYVYGRWIKEYLNLLLNHIIPRLGPSGRKWLANHYHGKVLTPELARAIITHNHDIPLQNIEQIIPYPYARDLVLKGPPDVAVFQCGCRQIREKPCEPIQVCMVIGQPFVDFIVEHHPNSSHRLTQTEALELLEAEHKRGHLHSAWFKDACLDRFYAICNCCKCCCGGIESMVKYGAPSMLSSGYVAKVDAESCKACGTCEDICAFKAIKTNGNATVIWEKCMGCGVCQGQCPNEAISLVRDERKGIPMDVRLLI